MNKKLIALIGIIIVILIAIFVYSFLKNSESEVVDVDSANTIEPLNSDSESYIKEGFESFKLVDSQERTGVYCKNNNKFCYMDQYSYRYDNSEFTLKFKIVTPEVKVTKDSLEDYIKNDPIFLVYSFDENNLKMSKINDNNIYVYDNPSKTYNSQYGSGIIVNNPLYFWISGEEVVEVTFSSYESSKVNSDQLDTMISAFIDKYPSDL